jgi:hypothetical protein
MATALNSQSKAVQATSSIFRAVVVVIPQRYIPCPLSCVSLLVTAYLMIADPVFVQQLTAHIAPHISITITAHSTAATPPHPTPPHPPTPPPSIPPPRPPSPLFFTNPFAPHRPPSTTPSPLLFEFTHHVPTCSMLHIPKRPPAMVLTLQVEPSTPSEA